MSLPRRTFSHPAAPHAARPATGPAARRPARGFSLVEAMVSAGIVGVMLVASVNLLGSAAKTRVTDNNRRTALALAQQLISEIQPLPYKDDSLTGILFGPELDEGGRSSYDDIDDYNNYREKPLQERDGTAIAGYPEWQRKVKVHWVDPETLAESLVDLGLVRIEVRVVDPRGVETSVYALRAERAVVAEPPGPGSTWVQWTGIELEVGGDPPRRVVTGINPTAMPTIK